MAAIITKPILEQSFEIIGARLFNIIQDELENQILLNYLAELEGINYWYERYIPFANSELPCVSVSFASADFDPSKVRDGQGKYTYFIDVLFNSDDTDNDRADYICLNKIKRTCGIIRMIVMDPVYKTLGFNPGFISTPAISSINIIDPGKQDSLNTYMARLTFTVNANDNHNLIEPIQLNFNKTIGKLGDTEIGQIVEIR